MADPVVQGNNNTMDHLGPKYFQIKKVECSHWKLISRVNHALHCYDDILRIELVLVNTAGNLDIKVSSSAVLQSHGHKV